MNLFIIFLHVCNVMFCILNKDSNCIESSYFLYWKKIRKIKKNNVLLNSLHINFYRKSTFKHTQIYLTVMHMRMELFEIYFWINNTLLYYKKIFWILKYYPQTIIIHFCNHPVYFSKHMERKFEETMMWSGIMLKVKFHQRKFKTDASIIQVSKYYNNIYNHILQASSRFQCIFLNMLKGNLRRLLQKTSCNNIRIIIGFSSTGLSFGQNNARKKLFDETSLWKQVYLRVNVYRYHPDVKCKQVKV